MKADIRFKNMNSEKLKEELNNSYVIAQHRFKYGNDLANYLGLKLRSSEKENFVKEWENVFNRDKKEYLKS